MTRRVLVVADDLTSATEVAGRMGSPTRSATVLLDPTQGPSLRDVHSGCVVMGSRALHASDAATMVEQSIRRHVDADRSLPIIVKTMDSSLRGPWAAELAAMMHALSVSKAVVAPAFPLYARVTRGGHQYADGVQVHAGPAGRDPKAPVTSSHIGAHLHDAGLRVVEVARPTRDRGLRLSQWVDSDPAVPTVLVVDAENEKDLELIAKYVRVDQEIVWCAGPGLALEIVGGPDGAHPSPSPRSSATLAVIGSMHPTTRAQTEHARERGIPVVTVAAESSTMTMAEDVIHALRTSRRAVLCSPTSYIDEPDGLLASVVAQVLDGLPEIALVLSGGDTALAVCASLDVRCISIAGEWSIGIPFGRLENDLETVVVTKAGGFGDEDVLTSLLNTMSPTHVESRSAGSWGAI